MQSISTKELGTYLTTKEASELFKCTPDYISKLIRDGKVHGIREGKKWQVNRDSLEVYFDFSNTQEKLRRDLLKKSRKNEYVRATSDSGQGTDYSLVFLKNIKITGLSIFVVLVSLFGTNLLIDTESVLREKITAHTIDNFLLNENSVFSTYTDIGKGYLSFSHSLFNEYIETVFFIGRLLEDEIVRESSVRSLALFYDRYTSTLASLWDDRFLIVNFSVSEVRESAVDLFKSYKAIGTVVYSSSKTFFNTQYLTLIDVIGSSIVKASSFPKEFLTYLNNLDTDIILENEAFKIQTANSVFSVSFIEEKFNRLKKFFE